MKNHQNKEKRSKLKNTKEQQLVKIKFPLKKKKICNKIFNPSKEEKEEKKEFMHLKIKINPKMITFATNTKSMLLAKMEKNVFITNAEKI